MESVSSSPELAAAAASAFMLSNGVMKVELNGVAPPGNSYPCITRLWVLGDLIVPNIAVGALFQMDIRGTAGNNMNPTQSGACSGAPSVLDAYQYPWGYVGASKNGILMGVTPRTFLSDTGACTDGILAPYYFNWGVQLGDGATFPTEAMIIVQQFVIQAGAPPIVSNLNELPTVYYGCDFSLYAYYLPTASPGNWQPLNHPATGSNYVPGWPTNGQEAVVNAYGHMRCNSNDFATATCGATYSGGFMSTAGGANGGTAGGCNANLVPLASFLITNGTRTRVSIFAVGNPGTVTAAIEQTAAQLGSWGDI